MYRIDEKELVIRGEEEFSFEENVLPVIEDVQEDIRYEVENNAEEFSKDKLQKMQSFLDYDLTDDDKADILEKILSDYEYEKYHSDCEVTIFDEDGIVKAINDWIREKFNFN